MLSALNLGRSVCIKCKGAVEGDDDYTICDNCLPNILATLSFEDCIDISERCEKSYRTAQRCAGAREARAAKAGA